MRNLFERPDPAGAGRFGPHALTPFTVDGGGAEPPEGHGAIRFRAEPADSSRRLPIVLVDGAPAAVGFGAGRIVVPAGRRLVQLQAGGSGRYWPVEVAEGGEVRLASTDVEPRLASAAAEPVGGGCSWRICDPDDRGEAGAQSLLKIHLAFSHEDSSGPAAVTVERTKPPKRPAGAQHVRGESEQPHPDSSLKEVLGKELEGIGRWAKWEWHHLLRVMGWDEDYRRRRKEAERIEADRPRCPPWVGAPRVTVGDRELPALWGANEYRLPPGTHLVEVAVPGPPRPLEKDTRVDLPGASRLLYELDLRPGTATVIEAQARIKTQLSEDGLALSEYSGRIGAVSDPRSSDAL